MSEQVVPSAVALHIIVKFLTNGNVKPAEILDRLRAQFGDETLLRIQMIGVSHFKKAGQRLRTCEDCTFCRESYGQRFLRHSRRFIRRVLIE
jgi:hypothetical protein